jgi:hypothetical protein
VNIAETVSLSEEEKEKIGRDMKWGSGGTGAIAGARTKARVGGGRRCTSRSGLVGRTRVYMRKTLSFCPGSGSGEKREAVRNMAAARQVFDPKNTKKQPKLQKWFIIELDPLQ